MKPLIGAILFVGGAFAFGTKKVADNGAKPNPIMTTLDRIEGTLSALDGRVTVLEGRNGVN